MEQLNLLQQRREEVAAQVEIMDTIRQASSTFIQDLVSGTMSVGDAFKKMFDDINAQIVKMIADRWIEQLFGAMGSTGGGSSGGGFLASIGSFLFGGGRAGGGNVAPNSMYKVNETGMEVITVSGQDYLMTGSKGGNVTPSHMVRHGGGSMSQVNNFILTGTVDKRTQEQISAKVGQKAQQAQSRNY